MTVRVHNCMVKCDTVYGAVLREAIPHQKVQFLDTQVSLAPTHVRLSVRDDYAHNNGSIFGKLPKEGGGAFPIQKISLQILVL